MQSQKIISRSGRKLTARSIDVKIASLPRGAEKDTEVHVKSEADWTECTLFFKRQQEEIDNSTRPSVYEEEM
eukprot:scaffold3667_cov73-Skeletonema_dohrnii-CCMP3373.AAC.1